MIDTYGRKITYLRLSVTKQCNLNCAYCKPEEGTCRETGPLLSPEEMVMAVRAAARLGVTKLRITGGEPLLRKDILPLVRDFSAIEGIREISLTTNGTLLATHADQLAQAGISRINISLDTLNADKYKKITGGGNLDDALAGLEAALLASFSQVKINAVLLKGFNDDEIFELADLTRKYPVDVRFIELMPLTGSKMLENAYLSADAVTEALGKIEEYRQEGVAKLYRMEKGLGYVGLIKPVSGNFCAQCNRIRLTADGRIRPCLFDDKEYDIRGLNEEEMFEMFREAIRNKPEQHPDLLGDFSCMKRNMNEIGG